MHSDGSSGCVDMVLQGRSTGKISTAECYKRLVNRFVGKFTFVLCHGRQDIGIHRRSMYRLSYLAEQ